MKPLRLPASAVLVSLVCGPAFAAQSPQDFLTTAIQGDNGEILLGQLAQQKGSSDAVRGFGKTLVDDHTRAKQQASDVAKSLNVTIPSGPTDDAQKEHDRLARLSGTDFDRDFADVMVKDHTKDIGLYQAEARDDKGPAGQLAEQQLPVLQHHLQLAQALPSSSAGTTGTPPITTFVAKEDEGTWRASKLPGVSIYGPNNQKVGGITDVLMDRDGKATAIVIGVGGFLGLGQKDVAVPFGDVKFTDEPVGGANGSAPPAGAPKSGAPASGAPASGAPTGASGDGTGLGGAGSGAPPTGAAANGARTGNRATGYPDHGLISLTADQLKAAPGFQFAK